MQQRKDNPSKHLVEVIGLCNLDGTFKPYRFRTQAGETVKIDHISDVRQAASLRSGGQGIRYTCRVRDRMIYLFCETLPTGEFWFVEMQNGAE